MGWADRKPRNTMGRNVWFLFNRRVFGWKVHLLHGAYAWELQVGVHVIQWFYPEAWHRSKLDGKRSRYWVDSYGARSGA